MAQNYSQEDFAKMQQQAINRVREMQRQSKISGQKGGENRPAENQPQNISPTQAQKETRQNAERDFEKKRSLPSPAPAAKAPRKNKTVTASFLEMDSDVALILPLLLLLQRDGADEMLILALLYIMA